jgi:hypothetical protein
MILKQAVEMQVSQRLLERSVKAENKCTARSQPCKRDTNQLPKQCCCSQRAPSGRPAETAEMLDDGSKVAVFLNWLCGSVGESLVGSGKRS